jgi:hypothetical protein
MNTRSSKARCILCRKPNEYRERNEYIWNTPLVGYVKVPWRNKDKETKERNEVYMAASSSAEPNGMSSGTVREPRPTMCPSELTMHAPAWKCRYLTFIITSVHEYLYSSHASRYDCTKREAQGYRRSPKRRTEYMKEVKQVESNRFFEINSFTPEFCPLTASRTAPRWP